jgi:two-component system, OmpR family, phosphate regulon sensor histidine kinase PhoR
LEKIVKDSIFKLHHQAEKAGVQLQYQPQPVEKAKSGGNEIGTGYLVEVDPDRISQVMINLISNAITYTPQGGSIQVSIETKTDRYTVHVKDTGIGIPPADIPRLFERFYRVDKTRSRRSGGTGLGLAIVKHIIEGHGGTVHVESEVGKGSDFSFSIPRKRVE